MSTWLTEKGQIGVHVADQKCQISVHVDRKRVKSVSTWIGQTK